MVQGFFLVHFLHRSAALRSVLPLHHLCLNRWYWWATVCCIDFHLLLKITTVHFSILPLSSVLKENVFIWMNTASTVYNSPKNILLRNCKIAIDSLVCLLFPARWIERRNTKGELFESLFNLCLFILCLNLICRHFHFYFCHQTSDLWVNVRDRKPAGLHSELLISPVEYRLGMELNPLTSDRYQFPHRAPCIILG